MGEFSKYIFICSQSPFILIHPQLDKLTLFFKEQTWVDRKYETLIMLNQVTAAMQLAYSLYLGGVVHQALSCMRELTHQRSCQIG